MQETMEKLTKYERPTIMVVVSEPFMEDTTLSGNAGGGSNNNPDPTHPIGDAKVNNFVFDDEEDN
jgi:hypothetical protein